jgi:4a-hydroxytetrahydrobiopterin dehydratase
MYNMSPHCQVTKALTDAEVADYGRRLNNWEIAQQVDALALKKSYRLNNFIIGTQFANRITELAESHQHHPEIRLRWGEADVIWFTHSCNGLRPLDFKMAQKTDDLYCQLTQPQAPNSKEAL